MADEVLNNMLGWDDELDYTESQFEDLEDGEYDFIVDHIERTQSQKGSNMVVVYLNIIGTNVQLKDRIVLLRSCAWKISQFFACIGLAKGTPGEKLNLKSFQKAPGMRGRCEIVHEKNSAQAKDPNGTHMEVRNYLKKASDENSWSSGGF